MVFVFSQQSVDPALVSLEAQVPASQQKNIFQVTNLTHFIVEDSLFQVLSTNLF